MPRVHHVKKAAKDNPAVKKGEPYYWWKFRYGGKRYSKTYPKLSQLTQSEFLGAMYDLQERFEGLEASAADSLEDLVAELNDIASEVQEQGEECMSKKENMPESLQEGDTGVLLEERSNQCEEIASALENAASEIEELVADEDKEEDDKVSEAQSALEGVDWSFE